MKRLLPLVLLTACSSDTTEIPEVKSDLDRDLQPNVSAGDFATLVDGNTAFATDLYKQVKDDPGNLFMSPHSISIALAMTYAGANTNTAAQMAHALHFDLPVDQLHSAFNKLDLDLASRGKNSNSSEIPFRLKATNAIFGQKDKSFVQLFLDTLARNYGAGMRVLDFFNDPDGSRETINLWVEDQTNDKIKDLLPDGSISDATRLVLVNAIYFSAAWDSPFPVGETADRPFNVTGGTMVSVPTLHGTIEGGYATGDGYRVSELPYDGEELSMVVVMPDDLSSFEASLTGQRVEDIMASIKPATVDLTLPKFKFDAPLGLKKVLVNLGMTDAFTEGVADFSGIDGMRDLLISDVLHKGFVGIDEKGTEAAAATAVVVDTDSIGEYAMLVVDKPFMFFIRDKPTGAILFVGRVVDPR